MLPRTNRGMTLIELLAVIVILGIVASIAAVVVANVIEKMRAQSFVSNAYAMYEAARLHVGAEKAEFFKPRSSETLTYKQLVDSGMLEPIRDPFTGRTLSPEHNSSYVLVKTGEHGKLDYLICLKGETKQLCSYSETQAEIPVDKLSADRITNLE